MLHRRSTFLFPTAVALVVAACGGETADTAAVPADTMTMAPATDTMMMATPPAGGATMDTAAADPAALLETTVAAAEGGLTNLPAATALDVIRQWQGTLRGAGQPALGEIADDLAALEQQLQATPTNGAEIGRILSRMGERTTAVAPQAQGTTAERLRRLGELLSQAGSQLSGS